MVVRPTLLVSLGYDTEKTNFLDLLIASSPWWAAPRDPLHFGVTTATGVTHPVPMDLTVTLPLTGAHDGHFMVTVTVIDRTAWVSYFLATMKAMALMTILDGLILDRGCAATS
jgi:hypothetical protein